MNEQAPEQWRELSRIWKTRDTAVTGADIEALHARQDRRLRIARMAELASSVLGIVAALWMALASRFLWVGILTVAFTAASICFVVRAQRLPVPQGSADLLKSLKDSLAYLESLAAQLRYGRALGFVALFAVVMASSIQLLQLASAPQSGLMAATVAGVAITAALAWNMTLAWQVWRRKARLEAFSAKLMAESDLAPGG